MFYFNDSLRTELLTGNNSRELLGSIDDPGYIRPREDTIPTLLKFLLGNLRVSDHQHGHLPPFLAAFQHLLRDGHHVRLSEVTHWFNSQRY